jgi:tetratricopeptide (TPR) repeat protein
LGTRRLIAVLFLLAASAPLFYGQGTPPSSQTVLVMPFENASGAPGLEWIAEAFPAVLRQRLNSPAIFVLNREDRLRAYDRAGIPAQVHPSRATIYRLAEQMDVDYVILGRYTFDGRSFTAHAQLLDMRSPKLLPEVAESGLLPELINLQTALSWDILRSLRPSFATSKEAFVNAAQPIRLDAFENYIRGILAPSTADRVSHLREAVRLNPSFSEAWLELGKTYYSQRQYEPAFNAFGQVPAADPAAREANFYRGLSAYCLGEFAKAESAFEFVAARLPLSQVFNNLGVVTSRLGKKSAAEYFQKAVQEDPNDPDYRFNLAVALYRNGDQAGATRELKQCLALRPFDAEAHTFSSAISTGGMKSPAQPASAVTSISHPPLERIKRDYDEGTFEQLYVGLQAAAEQRLAHSDPATHARFHINRGNEFLVKGFVSEAEQEFREAISLTPNSAEAHAGLARALEADAKTSEARSEAETSVRLKPSVDAFLVLARLDLRDNKAESAADWIDRALQLDHDNPAALDLKRNVAAKLAQKAQPLPN